MRRALSINRAGCHKALGLLLLILLLGCTIEVPAQKQFDCGDWNDDMTSWYCVSRVTDKCIHNEYVDINQCSRIERANNGSGDN